jgi:alpha-L-fucosidase
MKSTTLLLAILLGFTLISSPGTGGAQLAGGSAWDRAVADPVAAKLARPDAAQYAWHEQERIMFVHFGVATWEGVEYDADGKTDLSKMNPAKFDAEKICAMAKSWGAKQVMFVCKHVGGFCWWQTETTDYSVKNIPWKNGKGNMVREMADACRKHGLKVGVYIYSDDPKYMANMGQGGKTDDPAKQEEWNRLLRQQWTEVLTIYGKDLVREIWFDGSCIVPLDDIIKKLAPNAVILQSPMTNIRWVGNEAGIANDPNWNTLKLADLKGGVATQAHSTPDGDVWAPVECDVTLYNHNWFWNPGNEAKRRSTDELMYIYVSSAGRGSIMLLNSTPNTDGVIPTDDVTRYQEFGTAIEQNFGHPAGQVAKVAASEVTIALDSAKPVNCIDLWEAYQYGHRIRSYRVDAWVNNNWKRVAEGTAVGRRKIDLFPEVTTDKLRVRVNESVGTPLFRKILVHRVSPTLVKALGTLPSVTRGAIATASTVHSAPYAAEYLIDGNFQTRWSGSGGDAEHGQLSWVELDLRRPRRFAAMAASELADRVREFVIEVRNRPQDPWRPAFTGGTIGGDFKTDLPATTARFVRFRITKIESLDSTLWEMSLTDRPDVWEEATTIDLPAGERQLDIDLSAQIVDPGQYEIRLEGAAITAARPLFDGKPGEARFLEKIDANTWRINRTQVVAEGTATGIRLTVKTPAASKLKVLVRPK